MLGPLLAGVLMFGERSSSAAPVQGIQPRMTRPVFPRGSVMMIPLAAQQPGDRWPQTLELHMSDGRILMGQVAWIDAAPPQFERHWTDDPRGLALRAVLPSDNSALIAFNESLGPYLLADLPIDGQGEIRLGSHAIQPFWVDVPDLEFIQWPGEENGANKPRLSLSGGPDRPDPVSPFEYWRWTLLADRMEMLPPKSFGGDLERMAAQHYAALWQTGLHRLEKLSPRVADECRMLLTRTCIDHRQPFAAWVADPVQLAALLSVLMDFSKPDAEALSAAAAWVQQQQPLMVWPESEERDSVHLAVVATGPDPLAAHIQWRGSTEPPIGIQIEPGVLMRVKIDRPPPAEPEIIGLPAPREPEQFVLELEARGRVFEIAFGPRVINARPPAVYFRTLSPPLNLYEAQVGLRRPAPIEFATSAQLRKLSGRWEVFFECRRPALGNVGGEGARVPENVQSVDDLRGLEAVTIAIGAGDAGSLAPISLVVPEHEFWRIIRGVNDGTLQVHRRSYDDRWLCRIVLPETWFSSFNEQPSSIGVARTHGSTLQIETGPNVCTPWRASFGRAIIDLSQWDDLPRE